MTIIVKDRFDPGFRIWEKAQYKNLPTYFEVQYE